MGWRLAFCGAIEMRGDNQVLNIFKSDSLQGRTYLVTGASSGIGKATAVLLSECGARVLINGRDESRLNETLAQLSGAGHLAFAAPLETADQTNDWLRSVLDASGPLDGVFHCAGIELIRPARMIKQAQLNDVLGSSLFAAFGIARALSSKNAMIDGGSLVFMSSVAGSTGQVGMSAYSAAKAAIDGMVRSLACELSAKKIRVNCIAAGAVHTAMHDRLTKGSGDDATTAYEQSHLLGFGEPQDVAQAALYLLSPASRWVTGTTMVVDGGYMVR
jgi:NAD(P)-dependent dehydrogenase (short-subunit alcohol dehydrogenase family)